MLKILISAAIVVSIALVAIIVVAENRRSSDHQKDQSPPRKQWSQNTRNNESAPKDRANFPATIQIDCDPNCAAKSPEQDRNQSYIARLFYKGIEEPITVTTGILALATIALVIAVLCQVRDFRNFSKSENRAYLWPGFAGHLGRRFDGGGTAWNISILNTGQSYARKLVTA